MKIANFYLLEGLSTKIARKLQIQLGANPSVK
jgi:hypothetical protein